MITMILQSMKYRKFKNILLLLQFTIGFAALLFGLGCVNNVFQYKKNVESLSALDTVHASIIEGDINPEQPPNLLDEYHNIFRQIQERELAERIGFFESLFVYDNPDEYQTETLMYALNGDCLAMSNLPLLEGSVEPLKHYEGNPERIPVLVSASMKSRYQTGEQYTLYYITEEGTKQIEMDVIGILSPSAHFWRGGSTHLSANIESNQDFIIAPQFMDFMYDITYSMNSLLQLSGPESEREEKLEKIDTIFEENQLKLQIATLQEEVDAYYEAQTVVFVGALTFSGILLILSLLGCIGAILAGIATRYREFGIYYSMGFTKGHIISLVLGEIMALFGISFLIAAGISKLIFESILKSPALSIDFHVIFMAFAIMLACMMLSSVLPFRKLKKLEPIEMIKGENG